MAASRSHQGVAGARGCAGSAAPRRAHRRGVHRCCSFCCSPRCCCCFPRRAGAAPVKGEVTVSTTDGYARLVFTLAEETEADVRLANGIVIIAFKQPVDVPVDRIPMQAAAM